MPDEKTPAIDHVLETTLAQCKSLLGEKTYTYTKSLAIDHADIEKMVEDGRGRCTVTLGDMSGTRFERLSFYTSFLYFSASGPNIFQATAKS